VNNIAHMRKYTVGLTQTQVAAALGLTPSAIAKWETGIANPSVRVLPKLARLYGCTVDDLLKSVSQPIYLLHSRPISTETGRLNCFTKL